MRRPSRRSRRVRAVEEPASRLAWSAVALGALVVVLVLSGVAGLLAWREYGQGKQQALEELHARVVLGSELINTAFGGDISTLDSIAAAPVVRSRDLAAMGAYFARLEPARVPLFSGGIGWIDLHGISRVSSNRGAAGVSVATRLYFRNVVASGTPTVSDELVSRQDPNRRIVVVAVPTRDASGKLDGVLAGALVVASPSQPSRRALDLGFANLSIVDRRGHLLVDGSPGPRNLPLLGALPHQGEGTLVDTRGIGGSPDDVVAFATSALPGWTIVIDRPAATVFAAARHSLELELISIAAAAVVALVLLAIVMVYARRRSERERERARRWRDLRSTLDRASEVDEIAEALAATLATAFEGAMVAVAVRGEEGLRLAAVSPGDLHTLRPADERVYVRVASLALDAGAAFALAHEQLVRKHVPRSGRTAAGRIRSLHAVPLNSAGGERIGAAALLFGDERLLDRAEQTLVDTEAARAAESLGRALRHAREHEVALTLQHNLLGEKLASVPGMALAGRYRPGADGLEVGGDWYDVLRRPDGLVHLTVGDVAGRGLAATALMGELRHAFRAYAYEHAAPADVVVRLLRHVPDDEMATAVCATIDPYTRELAYASAGHPPLLLCDDDQGLVTRLELGGAPPLGFAEPSSVREARTILPAHATLIAYTDGLIERRDANIDDGIDRLASVARAGRRHDAQELADAILGELARGPQARDDIALLIVRLLAVPERMEIEIPAVPAELSRLRARVGSWLTLRGIDDETRADVVLALSEACSNAIEHAYDGAGGTVSLALVHEEGALRVVVEDTGTWTAPSDGDRHGHRGIPIIRGVMDEADIDHDARGTRVHLVRHV